MRTWTPALAAAVAACGFQPSAPAENMDAPNTDAARPDAAHPDAAHPDAAHSDAARPDGPGGSDWLAGYPYRKQITVTAGTALASFPVSVLEAADAQLAAHAASGADLAFTGSDGTTVLPYEVVAFTPATGALDAWVGLSVAAQPVTAFLYYGSSSAATAGNMWSAYAGVWHMSGSAAGGEHDSTVHGDNVTVPGGYTAPAVVAGIIGGARSYNGSNTALATGATTPSLDMGTASFSYEVWVDAQPTSAGGTSPIWHGGSSPTAPGYDFQLGSGTWVAEVVDGGSDLAHTTTGSQAMFVNRWVQLVAVIDRSANKLNCYADGSAVMGTSIGLSSVDSPFDFEIGRQGGTVQFTGAVDEVRVIPGALSSSWIAAEYANTNPATRAGFVAIGGEQAAP